MKIYSDLVKRLKKDMMTLAVAESCTGGLVAKLITDIPGSSLIFLGGIIVYSNEMKMSLLKVKSGTLKMHGAVSEQTVGEMLDGLLDVTQADIGIAISGIAGPSGGTAERPVGTVYIGVYLHEARIIQRNQFAGTRGIIRNASAIKAAEMVNELLSKKGRTDPSRN